MVTIEEEMELLEIRRQANAEHLRFVELILKKAKMNLRLCQTSVESAEQQVEYWQKKLANDDARIAELMAIARHEREGD
ncbi:hypothetical protein [Brevibacillus sp. HD3.3A]|uniref:hypothetical protein n=1 Tax=Brevibacillus sp. HD3.3A TaxID=2738979 RepID=UPI00156BD0D8|nr:hypothetical protein [Brevibacillus sp. HD3.3A]UED72109.1 hypothetical protein HP435_28805 [Brevibacillus sp. HD3.3A]